MRVFGSVVAVALALAAGRAGPAPGSKPRLALAQLDLEFDGVAHPFTEWGSAAIRFVGSNAPLYLNLSIDGVWRVRNLPLLSRRGPGRRQQTSVTFKLHDGDGVRVRSVAAAFSLSDTPLAAPPAPALHRRLHRQARIYRIGTPGVAALTGLVPPSEVVEGGAADGDPITYDDFPNQDVEQNECVLGAASNSLQWLKKTFALPIADGDISIDAFRTPLEWGPKGCDDNWPDLKEKYLKDKGIGVRTEALDRFAIDRIPEFMRAKCDIELSAGIHTAAVVGFVKLDDGRMKLDLASDGKQGIKGRGTKPNDGGIDEGVYDPVGGRFEHAPWLDRKAPELLVVECPPDRFPTTTTTTTTTSSSSSTTPSTTPPPTTTTTSTTSSSLQS